jgi:hypothetical protein
MLAKPTTLLSWITLTAALGLGCNEEPEDPRLEVREPEAETPEVSPAPEPEAPAPTAEPAGESGAPAEELERYVAAVAEATAALPEGAEALALPECEAGDPNDQMVRGIWVFEPWADALGAGDAQSSCADSENPLAEVLTSPELCRAAERAADEDGAAFGPLHEALVEGSPRLVILRVHDHVLPVAGERHGRTTLFTPGRIDATAFVVDRATNEVVCRARVRATNSERLPDEGYGDPLRGDLLVRFRTALRAATPPAPSATGPMQVRIRSHEMVPARAPMPPSATARRSGDRVEVSLDFLPHACEPEPSFEADVRGSTLTLTVARPADPRPGCVGLHSMRLDVAPLPPSAAPTSVEVRLANGRQVARASL